MTTAVYLHRQPSREMLKIIESATKADTILTNFPLSLPHTVVYKLKKNNNQKSGVWGTTETVHYIDTGSLPFNWTLPYASLAGIVASLAKDSDRMLMMFPTDSEIPPLLPFLASVLNKTVRLFKGTNSVKLDIEALTGKEVKESYEQLLLPEIAPLPTPTKLMTTPNGATVRPYQQQMIDFALSKPACGWFVDMGLGKTLATLVLLDEWIKRGEINPEKPILIVAPIMVALDTWSREVEKWGYDWNVLINVRLTPKKRETLLREALLPCEKPTLFLTNPAQLEAIRDYYYSFNIPLPFEVLIIDELSMFKSPTTKRNDVISDYRRGAVKFLGLTGTPAANHLIDIWNQAKLISKSETAWAGDTIYEFQAKYFNPGSTTSSGKVITWIPKFGTKEAIYRNLATHVVSMQTKGLVELPEISYSDMYITLPSEARQEYHTLEEEIGNKLEEGNGATFTTGTGAQIYLPTSDVLSGKLLQLAGGALYTDENHNFTVSHNEKLDALDDLIESATTPLLVYYYFNSDKQRILERHKRGGVEVLDSKRADVQNTISRWNRGEIPVLLAHPASVGHGLNLQEGGHTIVWFSLPNWDNEKYQQANKRLYRSGQTHPVSVIHIVAKDTIEEVMLLSLQAKEKENHKLMEALGRRNGGKA